MVFSPDMVSTVLMCIHSAFLYNVHSSLCSIRMMLLSHKNNVSPKSRCSIRTNRLFTNAGSNNTVPPPPTSSPSWVDGWPESTDQKDTHHSTTHTLHPPIPGTDTRKRQSYSSHNYHPSPPPESKKTLPNLQPIQIAFLAGYLTLKSTLQCPYSRYTQIPRIRSDRRRRFCRTELRWFDSLFPSKNAFHPCVGESLPRELILAWLSSG